MMSLQEVIEDVPMGLLEVDSRTNTAWSAKHTSCHEIRGERERSIRSNMRYERLHLWVMQCEIL